MRIMIDAGHGLGNRSHGIWDPGAVRGDLEEARLTFAAAIELGDAVERRGHEARYTRAHMNDAAALRDRGVAANLEGAGALVSLHFNAHDNAAARGFEIFTTPGRTAADALATAIYAAVTAIPGVRGRGDMSDGDTDKEAHLAVLRAAKCPAVLVELAFLSNADEMTFYLANQQAYLDAIAAAIDGWARAREVQRG